MDQMDNYERVIAVVRLVCALAASIATAAGIALDADALFVGICAVLTVIAYIWGWWKNNNLTGAAQEAQKVLDAAKATKED